MWKWMGTGTRNYDSTGHLLLRLAGLLMGFWIGLDSASYFGPLGKLYAWLAFMVATMLILVADSRAKNQSELPSLRTK